MLSDLYLIMLSVKQGSIKYHFFFESLVWLNLGLKPGLPGLSANNPTIMPMSGKHTILGNYFLEKSVDQHFLRSDLKIYI